MLAVFFQQLFRETGGFAAEDDVVVGRGLHFAVEFGAAGLDEPELGGGRKFLREGAPVGPAMPLDVLPVIHARAFELGIVELEAEGFDEMERRAGGGAEARDVAGVGRDFGFEQDEVHGEMKNYEG